MQECPRPKLNGDDGGRVEEEEDGFLFVGKPPASRTPLPPREGDAAAGPSPDPPSPDSVIDALLKRVPDSSTLRRRRMKGANIPLPPPPGPPPPKNDRDGSREVNRYRPFHRFARSPIREKSTAWSTRYVVDSFWQRARIELKLGSVRRPEPSSSGPHCNPACRPFHVRETGSSLGNVNTTGRDRVTAAAYYICKVKFAGLGSILDTVSKDTALSSILSVS